MKIVVTGRVQNECDIIESWCRYQLTYADQLLIYDDRSTDSTRRIIELLIDEGLPIRMVNDELSPAAGMADFWDTEYLRLAFDRYGAQLLLRLDADEFPFCVNGEHPRAALERLGTDTYTLMPWQCYVCTELEFADNSRFEPEYFLRYRRLAGPEFNKMIVGRGFYEKNRITAAPGNHNLNTEDGQRIPGDLSETIRLAHYPIRSSWQLAKKMVNGYMLTISQPDKGEGHSFHWKDMYHLFKRDGLYDADTLYRESLYYAVIDRTPGLPTIEGPMPTSWMDAPITLRYTDYAEIAAHSRRLMLDYTEHMAHTLSDLRIASAEMQRTSSALQQSLNDKTAALSAAVTETDALREELQAARARLKETEVELHGVYRSKSWRFTEPLRAFVRLPDRLHLLQKKYH